MSSERKGFEVRGRFYPWVPISDWTRGESVLAHTLTRLGDELFEGDHYLELQSACVAVSMARQNPAISHDKIIAAVYDLKIQDVEEVGFEELNLTEPDGDDAGPPDGSSPPSSSSSESGEESSTST